MQLLNNSSSALLRRTSSISLFIAAAPAVVVLLLLITSTAQNGGGAAAAADIYYKIPNPFEAKPNALFSIRSFQTIITADNKLTRLNVEEHFSLAEGLTYSLHRDQDDPSKAFVLIGDGQRGKSYLVRNVDYTEENKQELDCELDHLHHHKTTFPWQYIYESKPPPTTKKQRKKYDKWASKRFIYGMGAIWLNAIKREIVTNEVNENSAYADSNAWQMSDGDITVSLLFNKPTPAGGSNQSGMQTRSKVGENQMEYLIEHSSLNAVHVYHERSITNGQQAQSEGMSSKGSSKSLITGKEVVHATITSFEWTELPPTPTDSRMERFQFMLATCRKSTEQHRLFPSLMRSLSTSPERLYSLEYIERRFPTPTGENQHLDSGIFDEQLKRYTWNPEYKMEYFSLRRQTQTSVYQAVPDRTQQVKVEKRADIFMKHFAERPQSRRPTVSYHIHEVNAGMVSCQAPESEPLPRDHLFIRPVHFWYGDGDEERLTGYLTGLGALILNAADVHYKSFELFKKKITVIKDKNFLIERKQVKVDEWQLVDKKTSRSVHFYFLDHDRWYYAHDIADLVRVEIKNTNLALVEQDDSAQLVQPKTDESEENLIVRYDIVDLTNDIEPDDLDFIFSTPDICPKVPADDGNEDKKDDKTDTGGEQQEEDQGDAIYPEDYWDKYFEDEEGKEEGVNDEEQKEDQKEENEFEFQPGTMMESFQFPDFFEYLDGAPAYVLESIVHFDGIINEPRVKLEELVNFEQELAKLRVWRQDKAGAASINDEYKMNLEAEYYFNYRTEVIFRVDPVANTCKLVDEPDTWMNFLGAKFTYYKQFDAESAQKEDGATTPAGTGGKPGDRDGDVDNSPVRVESDRLRWFGVGALWRQASESVFTNFLGMRREEIMKEEDPIHAPQRFHKFKRVLWSSTEDGDDDTKPTLNFAFLFNQTQWELDQSMKRSRRTIEMLHLDSVYMDNLPESKDETEKLFTIVPGKFKRLAGYKQAVLSLPPKCQSAIDEANLEQKLMRDFYGTPAIPKFEEFLLPSSLEYWFRYKVVQFEVEVTDEKTKSHAISSVQLEEHFDRVKRRGKIIKGTDPNSNMEEIYIDGDKKTIYSYLVFSNMCKRVSNIKPLINSAVLGPYDSTATTTNQAALNEKFDFNNNKMGIAALWRQLEAETKNVQLRIHQEHDLEGNLFEFRTYRGSLVRTTWPQVVREATVVFSFKSKANYKTKPYGPIGDDNDQAAAGDNSNTNSRDVPVSGRDFDLTGIKIVPKFDWRTPDPAHHASLNVEWSSVEKTGGDAQDWWQLPQVCANLAPASPDSGVTSENEFPKLSNMISESHQFYMRSEITVTRASKLEPSKSEIRFYLLDEWLHDSKLRLKSSGLKRRPLDLLVYGKTGEAFDLSQQWECSNKLPSNLEEPTIASTFVEFWSPDSMPGTTTTLNSLFHSYYSPMTLWRLAERNLANVVFVSEIELAPKPSSDRAKNNNNTPQKQAADKNKKKDLAREFRSEIWRVTKPGVPGVGERMKWTYDMHFERFSLEDDEGNKVREWAVLQRIEIKEPEIVGSGKSIEIDVINYDWHQREEKFRDKFLLPEGYKCQRRTEVLDELRQNNDELTFNVDHDYRFNYEASLELVLGAKKLDEEDEEFRGLVKRKFAPVSGTIMRAHSMDYGYGFNLYSHLTSSYRMGTTSGDSSSENNNLSSSKKQVYDRYRTIFYEIDQLTGMCRIGFAKQREWELEFFSSQPTTNYNNNNDGLQPTQDQPVVVSIDYQLIDQLFMQTADSNFQPLNRYTGEDGYEYSVYERYFDSVTLNNEKLKGPAIVVRTFKNRAGEQMRLLENQGKNKKYKTRRRSSVSSKVILFDELERNKVKAIFKINLLSAINVSLDQIIDFINVRQCYNDGSQLSDRGSASFVVEYDAGRFIEPERFFSGKRIRDEFVKNLRKVSRLMLTQLNGRPKLEFSSHMVRVHFGLLDAPSASEYFARNFKWTMSDELKRISDFKLMPNIQACSKWCDQSQCVAMTYCRDHTCSLVRAGQIDSNYSSSVWKLDYYLATQTKQSKDCDFYYKSDATPPSLLQMYKFFDSTINQAQDEPTRKKMSIELIGESVLPTKFYLLNEEFDQSQEELGSESERLRHTNEWNEMRAGGAYRLVAQDARLNAAKLREFVRQLDENKKKKNTGEENSFQQKHSALDLSEHSFSFTECLDRCKSMDCVMVSYCQADALCTMISGSGIDFKELAQKTMDDKLDPTQGCSVSGKDLSLSYTRFENTKKPQKFKLQVANYTALECAALCESYSMTTIGGDDDESNDDEANDQRQQFTCLSFDYCLSFSPVSSSSAGAANNQQQEEQGVKQQCYLQEAHVMQDEFDRSILQPVRPSDEENRLMSCEHYSRSLLADFSLIPNQKLSPAKSSTYSLKGLNEDKCAMDCLQDDRCRAFEFCLDDTKKPAQSCQLISQKQLMSDTDGETKVPLERKGKQVKKGEENEEEKITDETTDETSSSSRADWRKELKKLLEVSQSCSIYLIKRVGAEEYGIKQATPPSSTNPASSSSAIEVIQLDNFIPKHNNSQSWFLSTLLYLLAGVTIGLVIQLAYTRLTGGAHSTRGGSSSLRINTIPHNSISSNQHFN